MRLIFVNNFIHILLWETVMQLMKTQIFSTLEFIRVLITLFGPPAQMGVL